MPDIQTVITIFVIALIAALVVAWAVGHNDWLANFVMIDQSGIL